MFGLAMLGGFSWFDYMLDYGRVLKFNEFNLKKRHFEIKKMRCFVEIIEL